ncbi:hypothetical protein [Marinicellulosiphila megalodicopiae]|uniref:hypothetical protein n=1 Tax=Marinicellulosiphila megalodicopiae TaxID=2724896 RepID=UPI003BB041B2
MKFSVVLLFLFYCNFAIAHAVHVLSDQKVRILNIGPAFKQGIDLEAGQYQFQIGQNNLDVQIKSDTLLIPNSLHQQLATLDVLYLGLTQKDVLILPNIKTISANQANKYLQKNDLFEWSLSVDQAKWFELEDCDVQICQYKPVVISGQRLLSCYALNNKNLCEQFEILDQSISIPVIYKHWLIPDVLPVFKSRYLTSMVEL